jgi:uncharacterized protein YbbC (DUF1343 family)
MRTLRSAALLLAVAACQPTVPAREPGTSPIRTGAEVLAGEAFARLDGRRVGVITNHTATVGDRHLVDLLHAAPGVRVTALFAPEHGIRGDAPAGDRIEDMRDPATGIPIFSLYGETQKPTPAMLADVDLLVFDIQDVGVRFYTYISTMVLGMQAAAEKGIPFMVLDRPNPIGGELVEGYMLEPGHESFVGIFPMPVSHGLTVGELARLARGQGVLPRLAEVELTVVPMEGWTRGMLWTDVGREWLPPSPNIPDFATALIYPGACFFEGTTASEGRGTYEPFLVLGAPWADGAALAAELNARNLPGLRFEPVRFTPRSIENMATRPKLLGQELGGVRYVVTDARAARPVEAGVHLLDVFYRHAPEAEKESFFATARIQRLAGGPRLHTQIRQGVPVEQIVAGWRQDVARWEETRRPYLLYR